jgi:hypothetical protein
MARTLLIALAATLLVAGSPTATFAQGTGADTGSGAVGAPAGVPGSVGNSSPGFGRSSTGGSAGTSTGPTNPPAPGASTSAGSGGTATGPTSPTGKK